MGWMVGSTARFTTPCLGKKKSQGERARLVPAIESGNSSLAKLAEWRKVGVGDELCNSPGSNRLGVALTRVSFPADEDRKEPGVAG